MIKIVFEKGFKIRDFINENIFLLGNLIDEAIECQRMANLKLGYKERFFYCELDPKINFGHDYLLIVSEVINKENFKNPHAEDLKFCFTIAIEKKEYKRSELLKELNIELNKQGVKEWGLYL